jgi:hypothetical protein
VGYERHGKSAGNAHNGKVRKTVQSSQGDLQIETPRDREGTFESQLVKKRQVRLVGMEKKILALYARGMATRDIESALVDLYGVTISHTLISQVIDAVLDEARAWHYAVAGFARRNRPLAWAGITVMLSRFRQAHIGVGAKSLPLFFSREAIFPTPQFATGWRYFQIQILAIIQALWLVRRLDFAYCSATQGHWGHL